MNKKIIWFIVAVIVLIIAGTAFLLSDTNSKSSTEDNKNMTGSEKSTGTTVTEIDGSGAGKYIDYSETVIADNPGTKILFFHAPWCPQCRELESDIIEKGVPENVTIVKVDYDTNQMLRQKYGVTLQTTIVLVDDDGNLVNKFVAYEEPSLEAIKQNLL